jgi:glucosamine-6-phosphate deaminase
VRVIRVRTPAALACAAADLIDAQLESKPRSVLALPTGSTPLGLYAELVHRSRGGTARLADARIFDLDEYCGIPPDHPCSYAAFIRRHLQIPLMLDPSHLRLFRGDAPDLGAECNDYESTLASLGGLDFCVLGLGENGHIAFNEPESAWNVRTRVVDLSVSTRARIEADPRGPRPVPTHGLTLGIQNVLEARQVLLLISGPRKLAAKAALARGVEDPAWPVTSLLLHPNTTVIELSQGPGDL